jgi:hypothetical protein
MSLKDELEQEPQIVNLFEFFQSHGLTDIVATQLVFHLLLTRTYGLESDARECAMELNISLPYVCKDNGRTH